MLLLLSKPQAGISFADYQKESEVIDAKQSTRLIPIFRYLDGFKKGCIFLVFLPLFKPQEEISFVKKNLRSVKG